MINSEILNSIKKITDFSNSEIELILSKFETKTVKRKTTLLAAGEIANEIYFVVKGCLRLYYEKGGDDISVFFFTEGMFAGAYDSFISKQPSRHYIETLENSELLSINFTNFTKLVANELGVKPNYTILKKWMIKIVGIFNKPISETYEMLYQSEFDYYFDSTKFCGFFNYKPKSYVEGIRETIEFLNAN